MQWASIYNTKQKHVAGICQKLIATLQHHPTQKPPAKEAPDEGQANAADTWMGIMQVPGENRR